MTLKVISALLAAFILAAFFITFPLYFKADQRRVIERSHLCMGTTVEIKAVSGEGQNTESAISRAFGEIERVENIFSVFKDSSEISRVNRLKAGESLKISEEAFGLIKRSLEYTRKTKGAFDVTVRPLVELWNGAKSKGVLPTAAQITLARSKVGADKVVLDEDERTISFTHDGMKLDLGGIAKGYATDRAVAVLEENGIDSAIVNSGGDLYCMGRRSKDKPWRVGVQHPRKKGNMYLELMLEDRAADTSGDYEKYSFIEGKRYSHIIDPRTGYPVGDAVVSATVIAKDSATADAFATALCVLGPEGGLKAIESADGLDAMIIFKDSEGLKTAFSDGFKKHTDGRR